MSEQPEQQTSAPADLTGVDLTGQFVAWLGLELTETSGDRVVATWEAQPKLHQPYGIVHGGVHCSVVETLASIGGASGWARRARSSASTTPPTSTRPFARAP